ncbi:MAG TPA: DNA polymerase III subunit alpha [Sedimentisphaerales bacterium]|nr:DNA polymerase III subunit alpha [Sedimentisphaerales bacterium]
MRIAALTCRSFYSLLRGSVSVQRLVQKAGEYGYGAIALADVNSMYGVVDFCRAAEQVDIKPVIGVEILTDTQSVILLAEDRTGYKNLCRITTARNLDEDFCLIGQLGKHSKGLICICTQPGLLKELQAIFSRDCLFAGCRGTDEADRAQANGLRPVAYTNFNCLQEEDVATATLLGRIRALSVAGAGPQDNSGFNKLMPEKEFRFRLRNCSEAVVNAEQIAHRCNLRLLNGKYFLPKVKLSKGENSDTVLGRLCHRGLAKMYKPAGKEVVKRLECELAAIRKNRFSDYFLVVHEIVSFAKRNNIPVEVRGSAAGSLVSHVLGFTRVCPIENNLYFERFMNPGRRDCPDIDVDFCWRRRDEVIRFCYENWGFDHVAMISNINRYRRRSAVRDVGRFLGLEPSQINELVKQRETDTDSAIYRLAERIIGFPRHLGVHCGGIVITPCAVRDIVPLEMAAKGVIVTQYDKDAAEAVGLIKIDLLGNRALSTVNGAVGIIGKRQDSPDIDAVNPTDEKTARMLSAGDSLGVFQCESPGMRQLLRGLKVKNKKDVAIALSLIRPGPASGGMKAEFIERHVGGKPFEYLHPKMKEVLGDTYGVMLYQEDVMRIAVEVAGYSVADADRFRSEVSKKVSAVRLQEQYEDFVYSRAGQAGIDRGTAEAIWDQILRFAAYSYCKAHATVYANIAWQTAFLKAHYPQGFYCSLFNNHQGMYPLRVYVWEAIRHGIKILLPHVNRSDIEWVPEGKAIRAGLNIIRGLSYGTMRAIIQQRKIGPFISIDDLRRRVRFRRPELQNFIHVGACDGLGLSRPAMLMQLNFALLNPNQPLLFDIYDNPSARGLPDYDRIAKLKAEVDVTGIPFSMHPAVLLHTKHTPSAKLSRFINREVTVAGYMATARRAVTNDGRTMGFVTLEDSLGLVDVSFFPDRFELYRSLCSSGGPVWIKGKVTEHLSSITLEGSNSGRAA